MPLKVFGVAGVAMEVYITLITHQSLSLPDPPFRIYLHVLSTLSNLWFYSIMAHFVACDLEQIRCIEEWVTKANRCPVCNSHVIDHNQLRQYRAAALQGHPPPSLLSTSVTSPTIAVRQRRRRTRGENGTFHLREGDGSLGSITTPTEQQNTFETRPDNQLAQPVESSNQRTQSVPLDAVANPDLALASSTSES